MEAKIVRPQAMAIQKRFFQAIETLMDSGKIKSLQAFCSDYQLHRPKYSNLKNHVDNPEGGTGYKFIDIDALSYLAADYGISSEWLLIGKGGMFKK